MRGHRAGLHHAGPPRSRDVHYLQLTDNASQTANMTRMFDHDPHKPTQRPVGPA